MLTPMVVQYLVGLCCLRRNPEAVDVTIGDLVLDVAAKKRRDVDITVTLLEDDGTVRAFKAYEVKREGEPLDVVAVEQLCLKLRDMPAVTHRAIVSASDFTDGAVAKAAAHDVQLFVFRPWAEPFGDQFPELRDAGRPDQFLRGFESILLYWVDWRCFFVAPNGPPSFNYEDSKPVFAADGRVHDKFSNLAKYKDALLYRSTQILWELEPAQTIARTFPPEPMADNHEFLVTPPWPHSHTVDVVEDQVYFKLDRALALIKYVTVSGYLQWEKRKRPPKFYILEHVPTREAFAGAAVADWGRPDGKMVAVIFPPDSRALTAHWFQLEEKHKNAIRQLKIQLPTPACEQVPSPRSDWR
jgi:hypothetical protein